MSVPPFAAAFVGKFGIIYANYSRSTKVWLFFSYHYRILLCRQIPFSRDSLAVCGYNLYRGVLDFLR